MIDILNNKTLKKRFIKDTGIPIQVFDEPYFTNRIKLFDSLFNSISLWKVFVNEVNNFKSEQDYLEYYNFVKDTFINFIKEKPEYNEFINCDMSLYAVNNYKIGDHGIFTQKNNNKVVLSFDLEKANFQALKYFNPKLVNDCQTWEELIGQYTPYNHIINSKYIRQVVCGTLNPKRQVTIEKYLMFEILNIIKNFVGLENVLTYMHDEIVVDITLIDTDIINKMIYDIYKFKKRQNIKIKNQIYKIYHIPDTNFYIQYFNNETYGFKCVTSLFYPIVYKQFRRLPIEDNDLVFYHEGLLCKFVDVPIYQF